MTGPITAGAGRTFRFSSFPGADTYERFRHAMEALRANPGAVLEVEPGTYTLTTDRARRAQESVMSGAWGENPQKVMFRPDYAYDIGIDLRGQKNTTLRAYGVRLLADGFMEVLSLTDAEGVTVEGLEIDHLRRPFSEGTIRHCTTVSDSEAFFDVELPGDCPIQPGTPLNLRSFVYDPRTCRLEGVGLEDMESRYLDPRHVRCTGTRWTGKWRENMPEGMPEGMPFCIWHTFHSRPAVLVQRCRNITLRDITVRSHPGMGITANRAENVLIEGYRNIPAPGLHLSTNTDATHFTACSGTLIIRNSVFEAQGDDAVNVHGYYHTIREAHGCRCLTENTCKDGTHTQTPDYPDPGDELELCDSRTLAVISRFRAVRAEVREDPRFAEWTLDAPLPAGSEGMLLFNASKLPAFEFSHNVCRGNFARGVLCKTRNVRIHDNVFEDIMGTAVSVYAEASWAEGTFSGNLKIEDNVIRRCGHQWGPVGGIQIGIDAPETAETPQIRGVTVTGNRIDCPDTALGLSVACTDGLRIRDNAITGSAHALQVTGCAHTEIEL